MKRMTPILFPAICAFFGAEILDSATGSEAGFIRVTPEEVIFKSPLIIGPDRAVLFRDSAKPGHNVVRVRFPLGAHSNPHFHSRDRHAIVIKGAWWNGVGETLDFSKAAPMKAGAYVLHPAGGVHWDRAADEETIAQIVGEGPVEMTQVGPQGAPRVAGRNPNSRRH